MTYKLEVVERSPNACVLDVPEVGSNFWVLKPNTGFFVFRPNDSGRFAWHHFRNFKKAFTYAAALRVTGEATHVVITNHRGQEVRYARKKPNEAVTD